jgi:CHRD domain-containing protein
MKPSKFVLALAVLALGAFPSSARADDDDENNNHERHFEARLFGANEVPPVSSRASGRLRATLNHAETELSFQLSWEDLTADAAVAHIHFGPSRVNGGVMVFFCGGGGQPACPAGASATITGTITAANVVGPTGQGIDPGEFAEVVRALRTQAYANVHNARFPGGEIRGQLN